MTPGTKVKMLPGSHISLTLQGKTGVVQAILEQGVVSVLWDGETTPDAEHTEDLEMIHVSTNHT
jgi:hypothetical protein